MLELGLIGVSFYFAFMYRVAADMYKLKTNANKVLKLPAIILLVCFACLMLFSCTYEIGNRGTTLVLIRKLPKPYGLKPTSRQLSWTMDRKW